MFASYNPSRKPSNPVTSRRKVFDNAMVAHVWAQQTNTEGRSGNGNFYFEGDTIYSYGRHFPIARFTEATLDGQRVVLYNGESRSVSTGQHQRYVRNALSGLPVRLFDVPHVSAQAYHPDNVRHLVKAFEERAAKFAKPHVRVWFGYDGDMPAADTPERRIEILEQASTEIYLYCGAFGIGVPDLQFAAKAGTIRTAFARYNDPKRVAKRNAAQASKGSRHYKQITKAFAYLEGVSDEMPNFHFMPYSAKQEVARVTGAGTYSLENRVDEESRHRNRAKSRKASKAITPEDWQEGKPGGFPTLYGPTLVRRNGDTLETSRGADCPFKHAVIAFLKAQHCRATGTDWHRNGEQIRVGVFQVDSIDAQGNMRAGCHTLEWSEMLRLAIREVPHLVKASFGLPVVSCL